MKPIVANLRFAVLLVLQFGLLLVLLTAAAARADVVHLREPAGRQSAKARTGTILDYTGVELLLQTTLGKRISIPTARVLRIETTRDAAQLAGDRLLVNRHYEQALGKYRQAAGSEQRPWVRREIYAQTVWCYRGLKQQVQAGKVFLALLKSDPQTLHFDCAPLVWIASEPAPSVQTAAGEWISTADHSAARLLGGSHLLSGASRRQAQSVLKTLTTDRDLRIALLAEAQLWRVSLAGLSAEQVDRRAATVRRMEADVRGGPYFLLGQMYAQQKRSEQAALAWMRLPLQYGRQRRLASLALLNSGAELQMLGQTNPAIRLYRELARDYPDQSAARQARRRLEQLTAKRK